MKKYTIHTKLLESNPSKKWHQDRAQVLSDEAKAIKKRGDKDWERTRSAYKLLAAENRFAADSSVGGSMKNPSEHWHRQRYDLLKATSELPDISKTDKRNLKAQIKEEEIALEEVQSMKNPEEKTKIVGDHFWRGQDAKGSSVYSTGDKLFSYRTVLLQRLPNGTVIGNKTKYSVTTSKHQTQVGVSKADKFITGVPMGTTDLTRYLKNPIGGSHNFLPVYPNPHRKHRATGKKMFGIPVMLVVMGGIGAAVWYFFIRKPSTTV